MFLVFDGSRGGGEKPLADQISAEENHHCCILDPRRPRSGLLVERQPKEPSTDTSSMPISPRSGTIHTTRQFFPRPGGPVPLTAGTQGRQRVAHSPNEFLAGAGFSDFCLWHYRLILEIMCCSSKMSLRDDKHYPTLSSQFSS